LGFLSLGSFYEGGGGYGSKVSGALYFISLVLVLSGTHAERTLRQNFRSLGETTPGGEENSGKKARKANRGKKGRNAERFGHWRKIQTLRR